MTDATSGAHDKPSRRHAPHKGEYYFYFALIFLASLPFSIAFWLLGALRLTQKPASGPLRASWTQANTTTPKIFWP